MNLKELASKIEKTTGVEKSAEELIVGVANYLDTLTHDPVAITAMAAELRDSAPSLSMAILANQPSLEEPKTKKATHSRR